MDDDSCVMKYIEIVPLTNSTDSPELPDVKHLVQVKVCIFTLGITYFFGLVFTLYCFDVVCSVTGSASGLKVSIVVM